MGGLASCAEADNSSNKPCYITGVTIQHSVDVVRFCENHTLHFLFKLKKVSTIGFEPGSSDHRAGTLSTRPPTTSCKNP